MILKGNAKNSVASSSSMMSKTGERECCLGCLRNACRGWWENPHLTQNNFKTLLKFSVSYHPLFNSVEQGGADEMEKPGYGTRYGSSTTEVGQSSMGRKRPFLSFSPFCSEDGQEPVADPFLGSVLLVGPW